MVTTPPTPHYFASAADFRRWLETHHDSHRELVVGFHKGHVTTRYYGWYANRPRGMREKAARATADGPPAIVPAPRLAPTEASRRWAALLQQIFEVDPLACPTCHGVMRIVACITQASVIDQILTYLRTRAAHGGHTGARSPPSTRAPASRAAVRAPRPSPEDGPDAPPPRGDPRRGRPSRRPDGWVPAGIALPR